MVNNAGTNATRRHWKQPLPRGHGHASSTSTSRAPSSAPSPCSPAMRARSGGGTLIHVVSNAATGIYAVAGPTYTASKHGARAMSATLNAEEGIHGIRSRLHQPGRGRDPHPRHPPPPAERRRPRAHGPARGRRRRGRLSPPRLPARTCMAEMLITPTDNNFYRATARAHRRSRLMAGATTSVPVDTAPNLHLRASSSRPPAACPRKPSASPSTSAPPTSPATTATASSASPLRAMAPPTGKRPRRPARSPS